MGHVNNIHFTQWNFGEIPRILYAIIDWLKKFITEYPFNMPYRLLQ